MALMFAICRPQPNWMPKKPKLMFQICQNDKPRFVHDVARHVSYPLTLPSVSPDTSQRLSERKRTTTGIVTITDAAP